MPSALAASRLLSARLARLPVGLAWCKRRACIARVQTIPLGMSLAGTMQGPLHPGIPALWHSPVSCSAPSPRLPPAPFPAHPVRPVSYCFVHELYRTPHRENIYPREVEEFLHGHPAVADVQVGPAVHASKGRGARPSLLDAPAGTCRASCCITSMHQAALLLP